MTTPPPDLPAADALLTGRRSVVRAAAVVWTAPVIALAATAPAHAASGGADLGVVLVPPVRVYKPLTTQQDRLDLVATIENTGVSATTQLTVVVDVVSSPDAPFDFVNASAEPGPGYTELPATRPPGVDRRFTFLADAQLPADGTRQFTATVDLDIGSAGTVTVTAFPGGPGTPGTASADFL